jgi:hypothetical protein
MATLLVVLFIAILTLGAACTSSSDTQTPVPTAVPTAVPVTTAAQIPLSPDLQPKPTDVIPTQKYVEVAVDKDPIYGTIAVTFRGGKGQFAVTTLTVKATLATGEMHIQDLAPEVNKEAEFPGTTGADRVEVTAFFNDGTSYKIYDDILELRPRQ